MASSAVVDGVSGAIGGELEITNALACHWPLSISLHCAYGPLHVLAYVKGKLFQEGPSFQSMFPP